MSYRSVNISIIDNSTSNHCAPKKTQEQNQMTNNICIILLSLAIVHIFLLFVLVLGT